MASLPLGVHRSARRPEALPLAGLDVELIATLSGSGGPSGGSDSKSVGVFRDVDADRLMDGYDVAGPRRWLEATATRARLAKSHAGASIRHILAHGIREGSRVGLALADGPLWPQDIHSVKFDGLVVLSACGVASSPVRVSDDDLVGSLAGAFLFAGADTVVASRYEVLFGPHMALMDVFHDRIVGGDSPAEAMRRARVAVVENSDLLDSQLQAVVQVIGLGQKPVLR